MELTVTQYAEKEGVTRAAILKRIKFGKLKARKVGHYWVIKA